MPLLNQQIFKAFSNIEKWTIVLIVLLSFTGISVIQIGKAMLTPFHLSMGFFIAYGIVVTRKSGKTLSLSLLAFMAYVIFVNVLQYPSIRYTSILYTLIYGIEITILYNLLKQCRTEAILFAFKCIVYLYLMNISIGFVLDTFHIRNSAIEFIIKVYYSKEIDGRPMGFSSEPSYAAFILAVVFLCYNHLNKHQLNRSTIKMAIAIILCIILSKSAYGFIFIAVLVLDALIILYRRGNKLTKNVFPLMIALGSIFLFVGATSSENEALQRIVRFTSVALDSSYSGKEKVIKLQEADGSAFARVGPTYLLLSQNNFSDFLVGKGAGASGIFLSDFLAGILVDEGRESVDTGIIPALIYDYGLIGSFLFVIYLLISFQRLPMTFWLLFLLILPNANINTQLVWFAISCFMFVSMKKKE